MPKSNQFKLLRTGGVRVSVGMNSGAYNVRSARILPTPDKLVPNFEVIGAQPFGEQQMRALAQRLHAPGWPKGTLNIYGLEGLITALLVLPLCIRPTVWLPLVWNESGWKIPVALQETDEFQQFMESLGGFMRAIDANLRATPSRSASILDSLPKDQRQSTATAQRDFAQGFGLAISQSNYLTVPIDEIAQRALYAIAIHAKPQSPNAPQAHAGSDRGFRQAILTLASIRTSRGPLGAL
jgi:yecA family protein